ncbi:HIG1 domain family member 2A, mitochondrial-like [Xenia sp. Carnegie-2017]|uniref:HIG1 domain family member 2A, mitochondrial-like n=1 Tax=Xenia sp. Carnegie-2017 TaxID=2897299 RepID=UPI001F04168F|nr:HIG1 domain family member 2A, mitochondrial-like [Xenia sp. Carnegie-2017]
MKPESEAEADDFFFSYRQESSKEKLWRKCKENPFVPIGLAGTVGALTYGLISFQRGHSRNQQNMMRLRVIAQGFTVISVVVGVAIMQWRKPEGKAT